MPTIYHYDRDIKMLLGNSVADLDPIDGQPLLPANSTSVVPPKQVAGKTPVFDVATNKWTNKQDNRGIVFDILTGKSEQWFALGPLPAGKTTNAPPDDLYSWNATSKSWVVDIAKVQANRAMQIKTDFQTALDSGVAFSGALFQSDAGSITTLTEVLTAVSNGWSLPEGFAWIDAANKPHPAGIVFLKELSVLLTNHKEALFARFQVAKEAITAAKTVAAVNKVAL